jgi:predicted PurR-regulated permease PerM
MALGMPRPRGTGGEPSPARTQRAVYGAIVLGGLLIVAGLLVEQLISLLLGVMVTIIISLPLSWFATKLERWRVPRVIGALLALAIEIGVVVGMVAGLVPSISQQVKTLVDAAPGLVHQVEVQIGHLTGQKPGHVANQIQNHVSKFVHDPSQFLGPITSIGLSAATVVGGLVIAVITAYYMAARPEPLVNGVLSLFPPARRDDVMDVLMRLRAALLGWLRGVLISMFLVGLMLYLALQLIVGLKFALLFGVISGVAEVVPYLGALASGIPPVAYALTISPGTALAVLVIYIAVHQIEANMIGPLVMARTVHLHPAVIALGVVAVGEVFGFLGLLVAVPILSVVVILVEEVWVRPRERPVIVVPP